jgi:hypothetical protein
MTTSVTVKTIYNCSLERAFKTPMLCDVSKVHTGFGLMPKVTHCTEDALWGKVGGTKKVFVAKSPTFEGGDFKSWLLGFSKFVGEWTTTELEENKILIEYTYTLYADTIWLYPLNWLFTHTFWRIYMKRVLENVRQMAYSNEPYQYQ